MLAGRCESQWAEFLSICGSRNVSLIKNNNIKNKKQQRKSQSECNLYIEYSVLFHVRPPRSVHASISVLLIERETIQAPSHPEHNPAI